MVCKGLSGFHQNLRGGPGWFEVRLHEVLPGFHQGSTRVSPGFQEVFARAVGWSGAGLTSTTVPQGSTRVAQMFCKVSWFALEGSNVSCDRRLKSHRGSNLRAQNIALLMGGTLSKTEIVAHCAAE